MLEYGETFKQENSETMKRLEDFMTAEGFNAAKAMLAEFKEIDEVESEDAVAA